MQHVQTSQQPTTVRVAFTPIRTHTMYGMVQRLRVPEVAGRFFGRCVTCFKVWRVRGWGYQEMCPVGATCVGFTAAHPLSADHPHHTLPYANHAPRCESGRSQRTMGSLAGFPWLGECSSISITLLLLSQETAGGVMSPYTHHIGFPYNICVFHTRASNRSLCSVCCIQIFDFNQNL